MCGNSSKSSTTIVLTGSPEVLAADKSEQAQAHVVWLQRNIEAPLQPQSTFFAVLPFPLVIEMAYQKMRSDLTPLKRTA